MSQAIKFICVYSCLSVRYYQVNAPEKWHGVGGTMNQPNLTETEFKIPLKLLWVFKREKQLLKLTQFVKLF